MVKEIHDYREYFCKNKKRYLIFKQQKNNDGRWKERLRMEGIKTKFKNGKNRGLGTRRIEMKARYGKSGRLGTREFGIRIIIVMMVTI